MTNALYHAVRSAVNRHRSLPRSRRRTYSGSSPSSSATQGRLNGEWSLLVTHSATLALCLALRVSRIALSTTATASLSMGLVYLVRSHHCPGVTVDSGGAALRMSLRA